MFKTTLPKNLLHPRYWLTWLGLGILYLLTKLPYQRQLKLGEVFGRVAYWVIPRRRRIVDINLKLCFPELSSAQRQQLVKKHFESAGIAILETAMAWWMPDSELCAMWRTVGYHHVEEALATGKGILLIGAHFTTLDFSSRYVGLTVPIPIYVTYREQKNAVIDFLLKQKRGHSMMKIIHRHDTREVIRQLKNGQIVWYAADQDYGRKHSVFAPFFGVPAATITVPGRYAKMSGAQVIMVSHYRLSDTQGYELVFSPVLENYPQNDEIKDAARLNLEIEKIIRQCPEQYFWLHRRFKTRPEGEAKIY